jgi:hypothetical protein
MAAVKTGSVKKGDTLVERSSFIRLFPGLSRWALVGTATLLLAACGAKDSPETQVRKVIEAMETAAEARKAGDVVEFVSERYQDSYGQAKADAMRYLVGYFLANQSVHLLTRIESLEFPIPEEARVKVSVGMLGREAEAAGDWSLAADLYQFDVTLQLEGGDWKVTNAKWNRT